MDKIWPREGLPNPLGAIWDGEGVNFALFTARSLSLFSLSQA
jgi:hypothetical protein